MIQFHRPLRFLCLGLLCSFFAATEGAAAKEDGPLVYIGTYTGANSKGIYVSRLDEKTGALSAPELAVETPSPSFLAVHPNGKFLYAVNEVGDFKGKKSGAVSAFSVDKASGKLTLLNQQSSVGDGPCHLIVDKKGKNVLLANYGGGSIAVLPLNADGTLREASAFIQHQGSSVNRSRQGEPHAHSINLDSANRFAVVADLGLDKVLVYKFDSEQSALTANDPAFATVAPGAGPRHFAFHPNGKKGYVINELLCTVTAFDYDAKKGALREFQTISTLPAGEPLKPAYSTAEIVVHPSGKFLYGSNRGHDTIAVYRIERSGKLAYVENEPTQGKTPRNFAISPSGKWLLAENQNSGSIVTFRIDPKTGALEPTGGSVQAGIPVCIRFVQP